MVSDGSRMDSASFFWASVNFIIWLSFCKRLSLRLTHLAAVLDLLLSAWEVTMEGCLTLQADAVACGRAGSQVSQQENRQTERQAHGRRNERTRPTRRQTSRDQQRNTGTDIVRIDRVTPSQTQEHRHHPGQTGENKESCTKRCKDRRKHRQRQTNRQANNRQSDAGTNNDGHTRTLYGCRLKSGTRNEEADERLQGARGCVVLAGRGAHVSAEFWKTELLFVLHFLAETMQEPSEPC